MQKIEEGLSEIQENARVTVVVALGAELVGVEG
jgi:hypothetical protein